MYDRPCSTVMAGWTGDFRVQCKLSGELRESVTFAGLLLRDLI